MPESPAAIQISVRRRSFKKYLLLSVVSALLVSVALAVWLLVVPVWEARRVVSEFTPTADPLGTAEEVKPFIDRLGGAEAGARKLGAFLRSPKWARQPHGGTRKAFYEQRATVLLIHCGDPAVPEFVRLLDSDLERRACAFVGLAKLTDSPRFAEAAPALRRLSKSNHKATRESATMLLNLMPSPPGSDLPPPPPKPPPPSPDDPQPLDRPDGGE
jgi:hypothetical protein